MSLDDFVFKLCLNLNKRLGDKLTTKVKQVLKNNGVYSVGIEVSFKGGPQIHPMHYVDSLYADFCHGDKTFAEIVDEMQELIMHAEIPETIQNFADGTFIPDPNRLMIRMVNRELNQDILSFSPHIVLGDYVLILKYFVSGDSSSSSTFTVPFSMLDQMHLSLNEAFAKALSQINTWCIPVITSIIDALALVGAHSASTSSSACDIQAKLREYKDEPLIVLSNSFGSYGAATILNPYVISAIKEELGDVWLIPSSVHELLICSKEYGLENLSNMITEMNNTVVDSQEVLGNKPIALSEFAKEYSALLHDINGQICLPQ